MSNPTNIVLILTDQQRHDIVGAYGSEVCRTPHLDRLAAEGVRFTNAYSHCPLCTPTRASIYSGRATHNHGLVRNIEPSTPNPGSIGTPEIPSLAQVLEPAGYHSAFLGKWHAGATEPGDCGFDALSASGYGNIRGSEAYHDYLAKRRLEIPEITPVGVGYPHRLILAGTMSGPVEASVPYFLAEQAIEKLERLAGSEEPFFLALNFWGPHAPYLPSEPYASMYDRADIEPWGNFPDEYGGKPPIYRRHHDSFVGEGNPTRSWEECAQWAALYFGFMSQIDGQIGRVLSRLTELGIDDTTAVLASTDHGDLSGAHGGMHDKNAMMVEELMHIPLIARLPGSASAGGVRTEYVSNLDLPATVVDIAGIPVPDSFDGRSLLPLLDSRTDSTVEWPDYVAAECSGVHFYYETRMIVHDGFKYVFHPGAFDELYDLSEDPWELDNLIESAAHEQILRACRRRMLEWMGKTRDPSQRAFFLFADRDAYGGEDFSAYDPAAGNAYWNQDPVVKGDR